MADVALEILARSQRQTLANLLQLYTHDFSEHWSGTAEGELEEDGRFSPYPHLDSYWTEPGRVPLLLRTRGRIAGFCLLNRHHHAGGLERRRVLRGAKAPGRRDRGGGGAAGVRQPARGLGGGGSASQHRGVGLLAARHRKPASARRSASVGTDNRLGRRSFPFQDDVTGRASRPTVARAANTFAVRPSTGWRQPGATCARGPITNSLSWARGWGRTSPGSSWTRRP